MTDDQKNEIIGAIVVVGGSMLLSAAVNHFKRKAREQEARIKREKEMAALARSLRNAFYHLDQRIYNKKFDEIIKDNEM